MADNNTEEIDLGKLFQLIGNGFKNLFASIGGLFRKIYHFIIVTLIFIKKHIVKIAIASIIGAGIGYFLDKNEEPVYQSDAILETNFGSGVELYNQTNKINSLIENEEYKKLAEIFNIPEEDAKLISSFAIEPFEKENNLLKEFDYYKQHTDTIFTRDLTPELYAKRLQDQDYRLQKITAYSANRTVFNKLNEGIANLANNKHFNKLLSIKQSELKKKKEILLHNLAEIDSLRKVYKTVAILTAKNSGANGTNINLSDKSRKSNPDIDLFKQSQSIMYQLRDLNKEIIRTGFITNAIAEFKEGYHKKGLLSNKIIRYGVLAGLLVIFIILGLKFNKYLETYNKEN